MIEISSQEAADRIMQNASVEFEGLTVPTDGGAYVFEADGTSLFWSLPEAPRSDVRPPVLDEA